MSDAIYWARLQDLNPAIEALPHSQDSLMILERLPVTWLDEATRQEGLRFDWLDLNENFNRWERGRIFNREGELRWEKAGADFQTVYVGAETALTGFKRDETLRLESARIEQRVYHLWGQRLTPAQLADIGQPPDEQLFIELIVPRLLRYPVAQPAERVKLQTVEYFEPTTGERLYYRFQGVEAA